MSFQRKRLNLRIITDNVSSKTEGLVLEPLGILDRRAIVPQAVEVSLAETHDPDLEAAQSDNLDTENRFTDVVRRIWL